MVLRLRSADRKWSHLRQRRLTPSLPKALQVLPPPPRPPSPSAQAPLLANGRRFRLGHTWPLTRIYSPTGRSSSGLHSTSGTTPRYGTRWQTPSAPHPWLPTTSSVPVIPSFLTVGCSSLAAIMAALVMDSRTRRSTIPARTRGRRYQTCRTLAGIQQTPRWQTVMSWLWQERLHLLQTARCRRSGTLPRIAGST